jgi:hypothetical protein
MASSAVRSRAWSTVTARTGGTRSGIPSTLRRLSGGRVDATALLVLWLVRSSVPALLLAGVSYAWVVSETRFEAIPQVTSPGQAVQLLL